MKIKALLLLTCTFAFSFLFGQGATKKVMLEEYTTTLCGFCPPKSYEIIQWHETHPNSVFLTIHEGFGRDSMSNDLTSAIYNALKPAGSSFAPAMMIDRTVFPWIDSLCPYISPNKGFDTIALRVMNEPAPVDIQILGTYDSAQNKISATVNVKFVTTVPTGEYRVNLFLIEDSVTGTGYPAYDQKCYDSGFATSHYPNLPFTDGKIIGYPHRFVLRKTLVGNNWGTTATTPAIPASPVVGTNYVYTLSTPFNVPSAYSKTRLSLIATVSRYTSGNKAENYILNANSIKLTSNFSTEIADNQSNVSFGKVYPNPATNQINVIFTLNRQSDILITVTDLMGRTMTIIPMKSLNSGAYEIPVSTASFAKGIYFICLQSTDYKVTQKIIVE